jgi:antitoxin VapB
MADYVTNRSGLASTAGMPAEALGILNQLSKRAPCDPREYGICRWHMLGGRMTDQRHVRLFRNGRNQAVRIPVEFELPGNEAIMHRDGDRLVIEPVRKRGLIALLKTMKPLKDPFPDIDDAVPPPEEVL